MWAILSTAGSCIFSEDVHTSKMWHEVMQRVSSRGHYQLVIKALTANFK